MLRRIVLSHAYSLSSLPVERNIADTRYYSRHYRQQLRAEVLLDSVSQITGVPETFNAMPPGAQARELWSHRIESLFLDEFTCLSDYSDASEEDCAELRFVKSQGNEEPRPYGRDGGPWRR